MILRVLTPIAPAEGVALASVAANWFDVVSVPTPLWQNFTTVSTSSSVLIEKLLTAYQHGATYFKACLKVYSEWCLRVSNQSARASANSQYEFTLMMALSSANSPDNQWISLITAPCSRQW